MSDRPFIQILITIGTGQSPPVKIGCEVDPEADRLLIWSAFDKAFSATLRERDRLMAKPDPWLHAMVSVRPGAAVLAFVPALYGRVGQVIDTKNPDLVVVQWGEGAAFSTIISVLDLEKVTG